MKLFRFEAAVGREIDAYGSVQLVMSSILRLSGDAHIGCMHIGAGGVVGYHQATEPQLFLVVQGVGWVRGAEDRRVKLSAGQAAWWAAGEWHESGSDEGMVAIVIEGERVDPSQSMQAWDEGILLRNDRG
jgi:quercetin dioxygenase-like cupin family protein